MGLTKMALGEAGKDLVALAAADYFFDNKYKRAVMENFTNLVPMERTGSLRQSLRHARSFLDRGYNALIFPEGTRSLTGEMADFKPVVGYLALHVARRHSSDVIWRAPTKRCRKAQTIIKSRDVGARIGRFLSIEELEEMTKGMPRAEAYRLIAARVRHEVENLRDRTRSTRKPSQRWKANAHTLRRLSDVERKSARADVKVHDAKMLRIVTSSVTLHCLRHSLRLYVYSVAELIQSERSCQLKKTPQKRTARMTPAKQARSGAQRLRNGPRLDSDHRRHRFSWFTSGAPTG